MSKTVKVFQFKNLKAPPEWRTIRVNEFTFFMSSI